MVEQAKRRVFEIKPFTDKERDEHFGRLVSLGFLGRVPSKPYDCWPLHYLQSVVTGNTWKEQLGLEQRARMWEEISRLKGVIDPQVYYQAMERLLYRDL